MAKKKLENRCKLIVFVTGKRGSGKTTYIRRFFSRLDWVCLGDGPFDCGKVVRAFDACSAGVVIECVRMPSKGDLVTMLALSGVFGCEQFEVEHDGHRQNTYRREHRLAVAASKRSPHSSWLRLDDAEFADIDRVG